MKCAFFIHIKSIRLPSLQFIFKHRQNTSKSSLSGQKQMTKKIKITLPMAKAHRYLSEHLYT